MIDLRGSLHHHCGRGEDFVTIPGQRRINPLSESGGMGIPIGKLSLYIACAAFLPSFFRSEHPRRPEALYLNG
jgi:hypothetical protein